MSEIKIICDGCKEEIKYIRHILIDLKNPDKPIVRFYCSSKCLCFHVDYVYWGDENE